MKDCLFCKMASGDIKPDMVMQNDQLIAFRDINPQAATHILVVPRKHISTLNDLVQEDAGTIENMVSAARSIAHQEGIDISGYRLVMNCNPEGGQTVYHIHLHLLGGRHMGWPPG